MPRFFVSGSAVSEGTVTIGGADAYHIARSLRMAVGETVTVCTSEGQELTCELIRIRDEAVEGRILSERPAEGESPVSVALYVAYPKGDKLETVVQKATELGVSSVTPFTSEFVVRKPKPDKINAETERLSRIAAEAAKQSRRGRIPTVGLPLSFAGMLDAAKSSDLVLFCYEGEGTLPLPAALPADRPRRVAVIVGSEGGFSPREVEAAIAAGFTPIGLGKRILRCETAPLFVLSCLSFRYEL